LFPAALKLLETSVLPAKATPAAAKTASAANNTNLRMMPPLFAAPQWRNARQH
jgi:hypothetical protein